MSNGIWSWEKDKSDVVFPTTQAVAVYQAEGGEIVIRQSGLPDEDDSIILIPLAHVDALIKALKDAALPF